MPKSPSPHLLYYVTNSSISPAEFADIVKDLRDVSEPWSYTITATDVNFSGPVDEYFQNPDLVPAKNQLVSLLLKSSLRIDNVVIAVQLSIQMDTRTVSLSINQTKPALHSKLFNLATILDLRERTLLLLPPADPTIVRNSYDFDHALELLGELKAIHAETKSLKSLATENADAIQKDSAIVANNLKALIDAKIDADAVREKINSILVEMRGDRERSLNWVDEVRSNASFGAVARQEIDAAVTDATRTRTQIKDTAEEFSRLVESSRTDISSLTDEVKRILSDNRSSLETLRSEAEQKAREIASRLGDVVGLEMHAAFKAQKVELDNSKFGWILAVGAVTIGLIWVSVETIHAASTIVEKSQSVNTGNSSNVNSDPTVSLLILRLILFPPLIVAEVFVIANYNRIARLSEHYAFKAALAGSITHYHQVIKQSKEEGEAIRQFLVESLNRLFSEPQFDHPRSRLAGRLLKSAEQLGVRVLKEGGRTIRSISKNSGKAEDK